MGIVETILLSNRWFTTNDGHDEDVAQLNVKVYFGYVILVSGSADVQEQSLLVLVVVVVAAVPVVVEVVVVVAVVPVVVQVVVVLVDVPLVVMVAVELHLVVLEQLVG